VRSIVRGIRGGLERMARNDGPQSDGYQRFGNIQNAAHVGRRSVGRPPIPFQRENRLKSFGDHADTRHEGYRSGVFQGGRPEKFSRHGGLMPILVLTTIDLPRAARRDARSAGTRCLVCRGWVGALAVCRGSGGSHRCRLDHAAHAISPRPPRITQVPPPLLRASPPARLSLLRAGGHQHRLDPYAWSSAAAATVWDCRSPAVHDQRQGRRRAASQHAALGGGERVGA